MSFARPEILFLLVLPALIIVFTLLYRARATRMPVDGLQVEKRPFLNLALVFVSLLPALVLAVVITIVAGPLALDDGAEKRKVTNIEIALDVSGSMSWGLGGGTELSRYEVAIEAIQGFTSKRRGDACGLTIFGGETLRWTPLTKDLDAIAQATPFLNPSKMPRQMNSTAIAKALRSCRSTLEQKTTGDRLVILVSDGESPDLRGAGARRVGQELAEADIDIYAIHIGSGVAPAQLYEVVEQTNGDVFASDDPRGLKEIFAHIDRMQAAEVEAAAPQAVESYYWFAIAGLAAIGLYACSLLGLRSAPW